MTITSISEAKARLSGLIERVQAGEEAAIGKAGKPVPKLVPFAHAATPRRPGALKGQIFISYDFDELPDELASAFGMRDPWLAPRLQRPAVRAPGPFRA